MTWVAAGVGAFVVLVVFGIAVLLRSERFHGYLLRTVQQKASEALGSKAEMRDFAVHWSSISPTVDLYGVVIHGAAPYSDPPLLETDALHLGLTVTSLLHKAWYVSDVRIEHPVARIFTDRDGHTNLPQAKQEKPRSQSSISVFDLGIRHLLLERGEIYYNNRKSVLSADVHQQSFIRTPGTSVAINGTISDNAALQIRANSNDLHELEAIAAGFRALGAEPAGIYGHANLNATVRGSTRNPQVSGQLSADNLRVRGSQWKLFRADFAVSPSQIRVDNGELDSANRGRVTFKLATALQNWSPTNSTPFQVQLAASQIDVADLLKAAGSTTPVAGMLSADITASGTQLSPTGQGTIGLTAARVAGEPIRTVDVQFQRTGKQVNANLKIDLPAGSANAHIQYEPATQAYTAEVHAPGIKLDQLETVKARNLELQGVLGINASGRGTIEDPQLQAVIEVPQLQVRDQVIRGLKLQTNAANHIANFTLDSDVINTHAGGHGTIRLNGDYFADVVFDTQAIPIAPLVAIYIPSQSGNVTGKPNSMRLAWSTERQNPRGSTPGDPASGGELQGQHSACDRIPDSRRLRERSSDPATIVDQGHRH